MDILPRWAHPFATFIAEVADRYPAARDFDPCPCGVTIAVIPAAFVRGPDLHFPVRDQDLVERGRALIRRVGRGQCQYAGPDAVLILSEQA